MPPRLRLLRPSPLSADPRPRPEAHPVGQGCHRSARSRPAAAAKEAQAAVPGAMAAPGGDCRTRPGGLPPLRPRSVAHTRHMGRAHPAHFRCHGLQRPALYRAPAVLLGTILYGRLCSRLCSTTRLEKGFAPSLAHNDAEPRGKEAGAARGARGWGTEVRRVHCDRHREHHGRRGRRATPGLKWGSAAPQREKKRERMATDVKAHKNHRIHPTPHTLQVQRTELCATP